MYILGKDLQPSVVFEGKTGGLYYKSFTIVIYDCNDSMIVEPVL